MSSILRRDEAGPDRDPKLDPTRNPESQREIDANAQLAKTDQLTTADLAEAGERSSGKIGVDPQQVAQIRPQNVGTAGSGTSQAGAATARAKEEELGPLFPADEVSNLRARWDAVQVGFVDEPRQAVADADQLIAATMKRLAEMFAQEREKLEHQWDRGNDVSTEDLRVALRRYRAFFSRLLSV
jgi:hypothetical protein